MNRIFVCTIGALFFLSSIVSHGQEKPKLTVYTYDAFAADWGPGPKVKQAFEAVCNCVLAAWSEVEQNHKQWIAEWLRAIGR